MVYVDDLVIYPRTLRWPFGAACHLTADSLDELHAFAQRIGMKREWFQGQSILPHYDLTAKRRAVAVRMGARELSQEEMVERVLQARVARQVSVENKKEQ